MMTTAQVVETSVTTTANSPSQDYTHPDDQTTLLNAFISIDMYAMRTYFYNLSSGRSFISFKNNK